MNSALDIAKYIICIAQNNGDNITNLKLQKLLYYAQAWFLVNNNNQPLFTEDIEAWQYGPVVPSVYNEYKYCGRNPIDIHCEDIMSGFPMLNKNVKQYLSEFCDVFLRFSATELVGMTHAEKPWIEADNIIDTNTMYEYYSNMLENDKKKSI